MVDAEGLSLVFMRAHPAEAARVLEGVAPAEAAGLLARVPARVGAPVVAAMLPIAAARSLAGMSDEQALALLGELATQPVVAVLRHVAEPHRTQLIDGLPTMSALAAKLLMGYVEDSVGAWTDPDVVALPGATRAADALERMRNVEAALQRVFVTGAGGRLEGWVPLSVVLRAPPTASLASLMTQPDAVLSAQMPLAGALAHPGWANASILPVIESGGALVGALTRDALHRALRRSARQAQPEHPDSLVGVLARGYWDSVSGGVQLIATLLPRVSTVSGTPGPDKSQ